MIGYYENNPIIIDSWTPYLASIDTTPEVHVGVPTRTPSDFRWAEPARLRPIPGHVRFSTSVNLPIDAIFAVGGKHYKIVATLSRYYDAIPL